MNYIQAFRPYTIYGHIYVTSNNGIGGGGVVVKYLHSENFGISDRGGDY